MAKEKTPEQQRRFDALTNLLRAGGDVGGGALENAAAIGSGMIAAPVGGLTGLAAGATDLLRGRGVDQALQSFRETSEDAADRMTYRPRGDVAQRGQENIGTAIESATRPVMEGVVDPIGEKSPVMGAAILGGAQLLGPKGAKVPKSAAALKGARMAEILAEKKPPGIPVSSETGPILPRSAETRIPAEQTPIPRTTKLLGREPEYNERAAALLRSPKAGRAVDTLIEKGRAINPDLENWYHSKPLMDFALNEGLSPEEFQRMVAHLSSASQRSPVLKENLMGSHMWGLDRQGLLTPESRLYTNKLAKEGLARGDPGVVELPPGMGSLAQTKIFGRAKELAAGKRPEDIFGEKLSSYYANKLGNEMPVTVDVNATKAPVISARNPAWLKTLYEVKDAEGNVVTRSFPKKEYESGKLSVGEASKTPGLWVDAPKGPGEYKAFEELWRRGADRAGVSPAGAQALGWYGSADVTALKTQPKTYIELLEQSARKAADRQGVTPIEAMRRAVRGAKGGQLGFADPKLLAGIGIAGAGAYGAKKVYDAVQERDKRMAELLRQVEQANNPGRGPQPPQQQR